MPIKWPDGPVMWEMPTVSHTMICPMAERRCGAVIAERLTTRAHGKLEQRRAGHFNASSQLSLVSRRAVIVCIPLLLVACTPPAIAVGLSSDQRLIFEAAGGDLLMWEIDTGKQKGRVSCFSSYWGITALALAPNGQQAAVGSGNGKVDLIDLRSLAVTSNLDPHKGLVLSLAYSQDGTYLVSGSEDGTVRLSSIGTQQNEYVLVSGSWLDARKGPFLYFGEAPRPHAVAFSKDGTRVAIPQLRGEPVIWNWTDITSGKSSPKVATMLTQGPLPLVRLAFALNDGALVGTSGRGTVLWDSHSGEVEQQFTERGSALVVSPSGETVAIGGYDGKITIRDLRSGAMHELAGHRDSVLSLAFLADGNTIVSGCRDGGVWLWDTISGRIVKKLIDA
jgi:WD40 repeat protein